VFVSHAHNLATNDQFSPYLDVFVRDLTTSNSVLVSVNTNGLGGANADSYSPSISSNGQFVAFVSAANNLVSNDTNDAPDIFVRDLLSGATTLVSVSASGNAPPITIDPSVSGRMRYHLSENPQISADGRWVVFESLASLSALPDQNFLSDIYVRDLHSNTTWLVSINAAGTASGNGNSKSASMSADGRFVAFASTSTDLVPGATNNLGEIFVRDFLSGTTIWASADVSALFGTRYGCLNPALSSDGHFLVFEAASPDNPANVLLIHHDLQTGVSTVLTSNAPPVSFFNNTFTVSGSLVTYEDSASAFLPQMSADGHFVAWEDLTNVYVWNFETGSSELVSVNTDRTGPANQFSHTPVITPDGRRIVFLSAASNLVAAASNGVSQVFVRDLDMDTTLLVSAAPDGRPARSEIAVTLPAISPNGRLVAFECLAADLVAEDLNDEDDIFVRDLDSGTTELVSQRGSTQPANTANGLSRVLPKALSADGNRVAFISLDSNFSPDDTNGVPDVFVRHLLSGVISSAILDKTGFFFSPFYSPRAALEAAMSADGRYIVVGGKEVCLMDVSGEPGSCGNEALVRFDLQTGKSELVSVRLDGGGESRSCSSPAVSSDGNLVAFQSDGTDLVEGQSFVSSNIFVRDIVLRTNRLVSGNAAGVGVGGLHPLFSPDDHWLIFSSVATDLTTNNSSGFTNLFAQDLDSNIMRMISVGAGGTSPVGYLRGAVFSADSRSVAFVSRSNLVVKYDFASGTNLVVCAGCDNPSLSGDGRLIAFEMADGAGVKQIVMTDLQTGLTNLISRNRLGAGGGNADSTSPLLSWDGRFVVFASKASDLVDNDTNNASDIFVRDLALGTTMALTLNLSGDGTGNGPSTKPTLAADGRTVAFQSFASDLIAGDYNYLRDVFILRLGGPDTDKDGMDDDWEMAYFGTLDRDGTGDFDHDSQTDLQEFLAGTDPTNQGSVLRAITLTPLGLGGTRVIWNASPGKKYQVQFRDELAASGWQTLPGMVVIANGTTASLTDNSSAQASHRFYRVLLAQ
jgi:Tol biopolymer transport system component